MEAPSSFISSPTISKRITITCSLISFTTSLPLSLYHSLVFCFSILVVRNSLILTSRLKIIHKFRFFFLRVFFIILPNMWTFCFCFFFDIKGEFIIVRRVCMIGNGSEEKCMSSVGRHLSCIWLNSLTFLFQFL